MKNKPLCKLCAPEHIFFWQQKIRSTSEKLQDQLIARLNHTPKEALCPATFNTRYSAQCAVWQGPQIQLTPGVKTAYLELGNEEDFAAKSFLQALQDRGIVIQKYDGQTTDILLAVSFSNYKAFKGHINLSPQEKTVLHQAALHAKQSIFISFGSPFGSENIEGLSTRLFCFSPAEEMQICAAEILSGKQTAHGKMPVW